MCFERRVLKFFVTRVTVSKNLGGNRSEDQLPLPLLDLTFVATIKVLQLLPELANLSPLRIATPSDQEVLGLG